MKKNKWAIVTILAFAQFVMVLDSTVMNVSITTVVNDLKTSVSSMQLAITFYTLTMAALMLLGGKLGDIWGRKKTFVIGSIIYALGSLITALSVNFTMLFIGWSIVEGIGAIMVIPAIASLTAANYSGQDRIKAYAIIGGVTGGAAALGPLIGGYMTTYLSWRYVFASEVVIMFGVLLTSRVIADVKKSAKTTKVDIPSFLLSATGLVMVVFGMLQSKVWGWVKPRSTPEIFGVNVAPFGISIVSYLILAGGLILYLFYRRQQKLEAHGGHPLFKVSLLKIPQLRSGLGVAFAQNLIIGSMFFILPIYLQMTLGYDALKTGLKILPLSVALVLFSILGARLANAHTPKKIIRSGQVLLIAGVLTLLAAVDIELKNGFFAVGMFIVGSGIGLLASQIGNVTMSAVSSKDTSEVGGAQGVFQNIGSSFGTALIGSVLVTVLTTSFITQVQASSLQPQVKQYVQSQSKVGVAIVPVSELQQYATSKGLSPTQVNEATNAYANSQIIALRESLFALAVISILALALSRHIPDEITT
jgi:MFS family permease